MGTVNKVIVIGHLGRDAELRYTPAGQAVANLNVATSDVWTDKQGQRQERTEWMRCVLWGKAAESLNDYLTKGKQVYLEGRLQTRDFVDKDGNKRYVTEIRVDRLVLLGGGAHPPKAVNEAGVVPASPGRDSQLFDPDDDIPF